MSYLFNYVTLISMVKRNLKKEIFILILSPLGRSSINANEERVYISPLNGYYIDLFFWPFFLSPSTIIISLIQTSFSLEWIKTIIM